MSDTATIPSLEQPFGIVNPPVNSQLPLFSGSMIHHKVSALRNERIVYYRDQDIEKAYGVSRSRRVLSPQLLLKKFDQVRDCLEFTLGLTRCERRAILGILRYWAYYGSVYTKQAQVCEDENISKATYWRAMRRLRNLGLIRVINRFIIRPHAQISNLYRLDKLMLVLARYLAEHGTQFYEKWLSPLLSMPGTRAWGLLFSKIPAALGCSESTRF